MRRSTMNEVDEPGEAEGARPTRWPWLRPGHSLLLFPVTVALFWAIVIAMFASIGRIWGPEGEQGTWGDVVGATLGNFVLVFVAAFAVSAISRIARRRSS